MYSIFNCSIAAATSAGRTLANSFSENSPSASALRRASTISLVESGFCALKKSASIKRLRFIILICSDRALDCVRNPVGVLVDFVELAAFNQQADFRFRAGIAKKNAAVSSQLALDFLA